MIKIVIVIFAFFLTQANAQVQVTHRRIKPSKSFSLSGKIPEGSGLAAWNGRLWTHNDSGEAKLFALDTATGKIVDEYELPGAENNDWEDIAQDKRYFYIGDIGNNAGERSRLNIIRIEKESLLAHKPVIDTIAFSWPDTVTGHKTEKINYNCEAMVTGGDSIYLFTKEYKKDRCTRAFSLPKKPGTYVANYKSTFKTNVLVTGAFYDETNNQLVLSGYNLWLRTFLLVFRNINGTGFFAEKCVKVTVRKPLRQTEGVATFDGKSWYLINEDFKFWFLLHTKAGLHKIIIN
jgi:hypothetical protein